MRRTQFRCKLAIAGGGDSAADWAIELGPKGGSDGGKIIFEGIPSEMKNNKHSITGNYIP